MSSSRITTSLLLICLAFSCVAHSADRVLIWRIGEFNDSSQEFRSQNINYSNSKEDPVYRVGKSSAQDWFRFQPGPANAVAGGRPHPFTVLFDLNDPPRGVYKLKLTVLYETPRLSHLKIEINGRSGLFYFHPKLDYGAGDWEGTFVPQTSQDSKVIVMPAQWFRRGANKLVFTALDDPAEPETSAGPIAPGHTGLMYDAVELTQEPALKYESNHIGAIVEPTIFYQQHEGKLRNLLSVFLESAKPLFPGSVTLSMAGTRLQQQLSTSEEFGEHRYEFAVPEWTGRASGTLTVSSKTVHKTLKLDLAAAKKWTVFIVPHEHLDIGFTDYAAKVAELHSQSIDDAMDLMRDFPNFRWTLDGAWVANQYLAGRSSEAQQRFLEHVRKGTVIIPPEFANQHTGNASLEGLIRTFYASHALSEMYHLPEGVAAQTVDVPSYTWSLASILHDCGIKYFVGASNSWRAPIMLLGRWNQKSPFYWEGPDGKRVLMWYSRAYLQMGTLFGSPWRMEAVRDSLPVFLQAYTRPDYKSASVLIFGSQLENTPLAKEQAQLPAAWNKEYAYPHFEFSSIATALENIEKEDAGSIPVFRGDLGPYWEDGYGSDALYTAMHRENQERILSAEKMSAIPAAFSNRLRPDISMLKQAWTNELTFDEHTWTYVGATAQPEHQQSENQIALKESRACESKRQIDESIQRSWAQLDSFLSLKDDSLAVFNALNWKRSGMVQFDLPDGAEIFDTALKEPVGIEGLAVGKGIPLPGFGGGYRRVRFEARDVPALGYKVYAIRRSTNQPADVPAATGDVVENRFYRITLDPARGTIRSIVDKELGTELVDQNNSYGFGEYLYVTGADNLPNNSLYRFGAALNPPVLEIHHEKQRKLIGIKATPFGHIITFSSSNVNTPTIQSEILLFDTEKKIDLRYDLSKERVLTRESAYIAFPFNAANPSFSYGNQTGWVNPARDELPGGSREWYVARHWTAISGPGMSVTLVPVDAPLVAFGDIVRGLWPADFTPKSSTVFSWLMNNYWGTNFPAWQGGKYTFRYSLTSGPKFDAVAAERFGTETMTPLETTQIASNSQSSQLPAEQASFLQIDNPRVELSTWKIAEDGAGFVLRLQETAGIAAKVRIHSGFLRFVHAWYATLLEDRLTEIKPEAGDIEVSLRPFEVITVRADMQAVARAQ